MRPRKARDYGNDNDDDEDDDDSADDSIDDDDLFGVQTSGPSSTWNITDAPYKVSPQR